MSAVEFSVFSLAVLASSFITSLFFSHICNFVVCGMSFCVWVLFVFVFQCFHSNL